MSDQQFIKNYLQDFIEALKPDDDSVESLIQVRNLLLEVNSNKKKVLIFGNGGSAAIASHFSVDLTKNAKMKCLNFNEASLITCLANDYGFEHWAEKAIEFYGNEGDLLIVISLKKVQFTVAAKTDLKKNIVTKTKIRFKKYLFILHTFN